MPLSLRKSRPATRIVLVTFLLAVIAISICEALGWPFLRGPAESFASDQLERSVRFDKPFKVRFIGGLRLELGGLHISAPEKFNVPHLVETSDISLNLRYSDILNRDNAVPLRIKSLRVDEILTYLVRNDKGEASWQFKPDDDKEPTPFPRIETLQVKDGNAIIRDAMTQTDVKLAFDSQEGSAESKPVSHTKINGMFREHEIKGEMRTNGLLPIASQEADAPPMDSKGWVEYGGVRVDFAGQAADLLGEKSINAKFWAKGPSLSLVGELFKIALPTTTAFKFEGDVKKEEDLLLVNIAKARIGQSDLTAKFKYDERGRVPKLTGDLNGKRFVLADLAPAFGANNEDGSAVKAREGRVLPNRPLNLPTLNRFDADIKVDLEMVDLGNAFRRHISPFRAHLTLDSGNLSLAKIYAKTADGTLAGLISVDASGFPEVDKREMDKTVKQKPARDMPTWRINLDWKDINLEKWLQASQARKEKAEKENKEIPVAYVTGTLNGKTRLTGKGESTAALLSSLDGEATAYIGKGTISHLVIEALGLDLAQSLGLIIKGNKSLPMQCAIVNLESKNGVFKPNVALVDTPVTVILADGNINMLKEQLDLRLIAKPKNVSPFTVRSPIKVTGSFADPEIGISATPIAARVLGSIALSFINPLAALLPFIDPGAESEYSCTDAIKEIKPAP